MTNRLVALLLSALTVIAALPALGLGVTVFAAGGSTTATAKASDGEFMRIFHLDCGRKYFSVDEITGIIDQLAANNYTHLQLAFANDGFRFLLDDMSVGSYSSDAVKTAITSANNSYSSSNRNASSSILSQTDMDKIVDHARANGIEIIPLFNSPGHMTVLLNALKSLDSSIKSEMNVNQGSGTYFDPKGCPTAASLTKELVGKYAKYFAANGSKYFNIGADECGFTSMTNAKYTAFAEYVNALNKVITENGMTTLAFNDGFCRTDRTTQTPIDTDILVCYWTNGDGYATTEELAKAGFKIINTNNNWYYVLGDYLYDAWSKGQWGYEDSLNGIKNTSVTELKDNGNVTPIGSMLCVWCDGPHKDYSASKDNVYDLIKTMAEQNPTYFKAADLPEQTLTDAASGITVTVKPAGNASEYVYSIEIAISVTFTSKRTAKVTVSVTITENGKPYTNGATLKIPYATWDSYLAENGFGIDKIIDFAASVSGDTVEVNADDANKELVLTVPHFSDVEIDATIANDSEAAVNKQEVILDINETKIVKVDGENIKAASPVFNPAGIASVTVKGYDAAQEEISRVGFPTNGTYTGVISDKTNTNYIVVGSDGKISNTTDPAKATQFEVEKAGNSTYYIKGNGYYLSVTQRGNGWNYSCSLSTSTTSVQFKYDSSTGFQHSDYSRYITISNGVWTVSSNSGNAFLFKITPATPAYTDLTFTGISAGTTKVTIGNTEYTVKVRKTPVKVTVKCVSDGKTIGTTTIEAKDNFDGGYYYSMTAPRVAGYSYVSGNLSGTVTGATTVTLTYSKNVVDFGESIILPISIIDYRSDGLLFDYDYNKTSYGYSLVHSNTYPSEGRNTSHDTTYGTSIKGDNLGTSIANTLLEIRMRYSGDITSTWGGQPLNGGWIRSGMVEPTLGKNGLPVYTDATVQAVAYLLNLGLYNSDVLSSNLKASKVLVNTFLLRDAGRSVVGTDTTAMSTAFKTAQTYGNIKNAYDLAWYLLNNLYTADTNMVTDNGKTVPIYGMATNTYKGIVLKKSSNIDGKNTSGYVYDSAYATTYDKENGYIYNTNVAGDIITVKENVKNRFWPIDNEGYDSSDYYGGGTSVIGKDGTQNGNFTLVGTAEFIYKKNDYFYFSGDDDVYLYINGRLALDLGGAHGVCYKEINLSELGAEYGLVVGQPATFTFFYMERCSDNSNFSMRTNIDITEPSMAVEKNAYTENGDKLIPSGSAVPSYSDVIYDFVVRNTGNTEMTNISLVDEDTFNNKVSIGGGTNVSTKNAKATLDVSGPFTVWFESDPANVQRFTTYDELNKYIAGLTLSAGDALHVKGVRGKFEPGTNSVFTYENTLNVTAKAGEKTLTGSANHKLYSFNIGDTQMAYVVDFGLPMTIEKLFDENVVATKYVTGVSLVSGAGKYGTIELTGTGANASLTYTLTSAINGAEIIELDVSLNVEGTVIKTQKHITIIPATTVYYEDNFGGFIKFEGGWTVDGKETTGKQRADRIGETAANVYGYDDAYKTMSKFSLGSAHKVTVSGDKYATAKFSFFGTGFDVISATTNTSGTIVVSVKSKDGSIDYSKNFLVDTYYGYEYKDGKWTAVPTTEAALWQIPVMKVTGLTYGEYEVTITAAYADFFSHGQKDGGSYDFWLDAIRIYDPAGAVSGNAGDSQANYDKAYTNDGEGWPTYSELRDMIIGANSYAADNAVDGAIFIDGQTGKVSIADYTSYGPKNELYLAKNQAIAFKLNASDNIADIQIALKNILENTNSHCVIKDAASNTNLFDSDIATATDMYHSIMSLNGKTVVIMNTGDGILSITNLKVTYNEKPTATDTLSISVDEKSALAALSAVDGVLNPKTPFEPGKVDVKVDDKNGKADITVITTPDVDEIEINGEKVTDYEVDPKSGNRIWKKSVKRMLEYNPEISIVARDSKGNASAPVTAPVVSGGSIGSLIGGFIGRLIKNIFSALFG